MARPDRLPWRLRGATTLLLALLCVVAAVVGARALWRQDRSVDVSGPTGPVTSVSARESGAAAAKRLTPQVLSYGYRTLDSDAAAVAKVAAPGFERQYARTMRSVRAQTLRNQVTLTATAEQVGVVTATRARVVALVFVDQETTAKGSTRVRRDQNRVLVTLTSDGGEWRVSRMDAF